MITTSNSGSPAGCHHGRRVPAHTPHIGTCASAQAKTQSECYDYLFESALKMHQLGIDASRPPPARALPAAAEPKPSANGHAVGEEPAVKRARTMSYNTNVRGDAAWSCCNLMHDISCQ